MIENIMKCPSCGLIFEGYEGYTCPHCGKPAPPKMDMGGHMSEQEIPYIQGVPEIIKTKITAAENRLSALFEAMYTCPHCGGEMYTTVYPVVACPGCGHAQNGTNSVK